MLEAICRHQRFLQNVSIRCFHQSGSAVFYKKFDALEQLLGMMEEEIASAEAKMSVDYQLFKRPETSPYLLPRLSRPAFQEANAVGQLRVYETPETMWSYFFTHKKDGRLFEFSCTQCPLLYRSQMPLLFNMSRVDPFELRMATVSCKNAETAVSDFVVVAQELCSRLHKRGFWADFIDPFTNRPYFNGLRGNQTLKPPDEQLFRDFGGIDTMHDCVVFKKDDKKPTSVYRNRIFTTANRERLNNLCRDVFFYKK